MLGPVPLVAATGASKLAFGMSPPLSFGGMLAASLIDVFALPHVLFQGVRERIKRDREQARFSHDRRKPLSWSTRAGF
jgi:hypothetical protein